MIQAILFDSGGVLLKNMWHDLADKVHEQYGFDPDMFIAIFSERWPEYKVGKISGEEFYNNVITKLSIPASYEELLNMYTSAVVRNEDMFSLLTKLKPTYTLGLANNEGKDHDEKRNELTDLFSQFHKHYQSWSVGLCKPHAEYYEYIIQDLALPPKNILFIDDKPTNIEGALAVGIDAVQFISYDALLEELKKRNVTV